jgi:ligand-binding sensor domain-containing protein
VIVIAALLWAAGCPARSHAQEGWPGRRFENLSVEQGLPDGRVWSITQDRYGFLWFGTYDGLTRFDGYEFKTYRPDPQDPNSACALQFQVLLTDRTGMVWAGSLQEGLGRFDPAQERFTCYRYNPQDPEGLSGPAILSLYETQDGELWIGISQGLDRFDRETGRFVHYQTDTGEPYDSYNNVILPIYQDQSGVL